MCVIIGNKIPIYEYSGDSIYFKQILTIEEDGFTVNNESYVPRGLDRLPCDVDKYMDTGYIIKRDGKYGTYELIFQRSDNIAAYVDSDDPKAIEKMVSHIRGINERGVLFKNSNKFHIMYDEFSFEVDSKVFEEARKTLPLMVLIDKTTSLFYNNQLIFSSKGESYDTIISLYKAHKALSYLKDDEVLCMVGFTKDERTQYKLLAVYTLDGKAAFEEIGMVDEDTGSSIRKILAKNDRDLAYFSINAAEAGDYSPNFFVSVGSAGNKAMGYSGKDIKNMTDIAAFELQNYTTLKPGLGSEISTHIDRIKLLENAADELGLLKDILPPFTKTESKELEYITDRLSRNFVGKSLKEIEAATGR